MKHLFIIAIFALTATMPITSFAGEKHTNDVNKNEHAYLKPGAPVRLLEPNYIEMEPQSQKSISVSFNTPQEGLLTIEANPEKHLSVDIAGSTTINLAQSPATLDLTITSTSPGKHYLMFMVTYIKDQQSTQRSMGIAVQVGDAPEVSKQKSSSPYVIMEAEETIH